MAKLLGGTQVYGNATINSYLVVSGNADLSGGNVSIGSGNTTVTSLVTPTTGNSYQTSPNVTISAPTTLYGATATANVSLGVVAIAANIGGGTGYSVGNVLTAVGNAGVVSNATFTVTTVGNASGGLGNITGLSITGAGAYYWANTQPLTFTGGAGSGANAFVYYGINIPVITYNGLGYTEPATATFSGGSPATTATAYPIVGAPQSNINILGGTLSVRTPGGELVRFVDQGSYSSVGGFYQPLLITRVNWQNSTYIQAQGQNLRISATSGGGIYFDTSVGGETALLITRTVSAVNYMNLTGGTTNNPPVLSAQGSDANISLAIQPKGTGAIDLAAGSSGVNISNGGTVTAITLTNAGSGYTSFPTSTVSVPTTSGGVQAVVSFTRMYPNAASIANGGTGYTVGDTLTLVGGTVVTSAATFTVATVSSGVVTSVNILAANSYTVLPTSPVSVTGGTGTGATLNPTYALGAVSTITNAGSGYVEQPTVTFSSSGGSGAAAYATVGSVPKIQTLGSALSFYTPGGEQARITDVASANRYAQISGGVSGATAPGIGTGGGGEAFDIFSNSNVIRFSTGGAKSNNIQAVVYPTNNAVNYVQVTGAATGNNPTISAQGTDTNVSLAIQPKGTASNLAIVANGAVVLSSGTGAITAIRYNALGSGYGSQPTVTISAPTTAGGVTAQANASIYFGGGTVVSGGTGYSVGDVLAVVGGSYTSQGYLTVTGNSSGVITSVTTTNGGAYYSFPANAVSVTGGTGSGATFNLLPGGVNNYNLLSGGSGYVEPPIITVTGGGGSGANAIARIGSVPQVKSLTSSLDFYTSNGQVLRLTDSTNLAVNYWQLSSSPSGNQVGMAATGGDTNIGTNFTTKGTNGHVFSTNGYGSVGLVVSHTASAVNYIQVTGAATGARPAITAQGSDATIGLTYTTKGTGALSRHAFTTGFGTQFLIVDSSTGSVNTLQVTGSASGSAPVLASQGYDPNIDLTLTPKGTGNVTTANPVVITNANVSTGTSTGALVVAGGVGIAGNVFAGNIYSSGNVVATTYFVGNGSQLTGISSAMTWTITSSNITVSKNNGYFVDTTTGPKTLTLPASATIGDTVRINDLAGTFSSNNLTIGANGGKIQGVADNFLVDVDQTSFGLVYSNSTYGWKVLEL